MHDLKIDIGYWLNRLRMEVHQSFEERLESEDITVAQWCILLTLYNKQASSIKELSEYIETDKASISRVVERLVSKKLATHVAGKDRRSGHISLTVAGEELVPKLIAEAESNEKQFFGHLTDQEIGQLKHILIKIFKTIPSIQLGGFLTMSELNTVIAAVEQTNANKEEWPYPQAFETLKSAGVTGYTVDTFSFEVVYKGSFGTWKQKWQPPVSEVFLPVNAAEKASKEAFLLALEKRMKKETTYTAFLCNIAAAGISYYRADMATRTVTYYDVNKKPVHVQPIP